MKWTGMIDAIDKEGKVSRMGPVKGKNGNQFPFPSARKAIEFLAEFAGDPSFYKAYDRRVITIWNERDQQKS